MNEIWDAWAAGFVDGEGALMIRYQRTNNQILIHVRVGQSVRAPLDRLTLMYGGNVKEKVQGGKQYFEWNIYGGKAVASLRKMRPFMMVKGAHADLIDEYWIRHSELDLEGKLMYHNNIREMQAKGQHRSNAIA